MSNLLTMSVDFDLGTSLVEYMPRHKAPMKPLSYSKMPRYLDVAIRGTVAHMEQELDKRVSRSVIVGCCLNEGITLLRANEQLIELSQLQKALHTDSHCYFADHRMFEDVCSILAAYPITLPDFGMCTDKKTSVSVPEWLQTRAGVAAETLGVSTDTLMLFALAIVMKDLFTVRAEHRRALNEGVQAFFDSVHRRIALGRKLSELATYVGETS